MKISYDSMKEFFQPSNHDFDALYILDEIGNILYAGNKNDGCIVNNKYIPFKQEYFTIYNKEKCYVEIPSCYMIKVNNGIFNIKYFQFNMNGLDKWIMTIISIPIIEPTLDFECVKEKIKMK